MTNFQKLKHDARRAEQKSDWQRAIDLYRRALDFDAETVDLSIYNRIGDLHMRLGESEAAVECYEQAADRYADQGMQTSAIALCNKILRIAPERDAVYRRLGSLHARTGLLAEGRRNCLAYVEKALENDRTADAAEAIEEFTATSGDEPIRLSYADLLSDRGMRAAAAEQVRIVRDARVSRGSDASDLTDRIADLDPDGVAEDSGAPPAPVAAGPTRREDSLDLAGLVAGGLKDQGEHVPFQAVPHPALAARSLPPRGDALDGARQGLERFREHMAATLTDGDTSVRYDLGVELMTIGLLEEALEEFSLAIVEPTLIEAANARIAECLVMQGASPGFEPAALARPVAEPIDSSEPEVPEAEAPGALDSAELADEPGEDELEGHYFKARLAQYRIRRAEERHTTDHGAHLEVGTAYTEMDLLQEAVREFAVALGGPRTIAAQAVKSLRRLGENPSVMPELALHIAETLSSAGFNEAAGTLAAGLSDSWGPEHHMSPKLAVLRKTIEEAGDELPALESLFPGVGTQVGQPANGHLEELGPLLTEIDGDPRDDVNEALRADDAHIQALKLADEHCAGGRPEEAGTLLSDLLETLQAEHRAREAMTVLDRLILLRPEDIVLRHRKTELALMVNDRTALLAAYAELGECLVRQGAARSARAAFGRILDFDPTNEAAKVAIAAIDRTEIEGETAARAAKRPRPSRRTRASDADRAEFDALLGDLGVDGDVGPEGEAVGVAGADDEANYPAKTAASRCELGLAFRQMGMWEEAIEELLAALPGLDEAWEAMEALSEAMDRAARHEELIATLEPRLVGVDDALVVGPLYYLARALRAEGRDPEARDVLSRVEAASPGYRDAADLLSELSH